MFWCGFGAEWVHLIPAWFWIMACCMTWAITRAFSCSLWQEQVALCERHTHTGHPPRAHYYYYYYYFTCAPRAGPRPNRFITKHNQAQHTLIIYNIRNISGGAAAAAAVGYSGSNIWAHHSGPVSLCDAWAEKHALLTRSLCRAPTQPATSISLMLSAPSRQFPSPTFFNSTRYWNFIALFLDSW